MDKLEFYRMCCEKRTQDLIYWMARVFEGQTIHENYLFKNARLCDIAKGSQATQRLINWCQEQLKERESYGAEKRG